MSGLAITMMLLIGGAILAAEIWIGVRVARRLVPLARQLGDPAQRASLLSEATRQALRDAGYDVATLDHASLTRTPELKARVDAELRAALKAAWRGVLPGMGRGDARTLAAPDLPSGRPAPIDDPSAHRALGAVALGLVAALAIGAAAWLLA